MLAELMQTIPQPLIAKIAEQANDPRRRTVDASLALDAQSIDLQANIDQLAALGHPDAAQLQGILASLSSMAGRMGGQNLLDNIVLTGPDGTYSLGEPAKPQALSEPPSDAALGEAEVRLGFELPAGLRQLYAIGDGGFGPGNGLLSLAVLVKRYSELIAEPYGPEGEDWPANLLPLFEEGTRWLCIDRESANIICWDAELLDEEDSVEAWKNSFVPEADNLADLMDRWLEQPTKAEIMEPARQEPFVLPRETIDYFAAMSPAERAEHGFEGDDWEEQLRRSFEP